MNKPFEIYGYTIANFGKERNGDSLIYELIDEENILLAAVADGVSKQPCDWLASATACAKVMENFRSKKDIADISQRLKEGILAANEYIISTEGPCNRMASTLSVIVWPIADDRLYYANIGDSRIYSLNNDKVKQLTKDDATIVKERVLMHGGLRVIDRPILNKVVGQDSINFNVYERSLSTGEIIVLATDGFYEARKAIFNKAMLELAGQENFKEGFEAVVRKFELLRGDDLSVIMVRFSGTEK